MNKKILIGVLSGVAGMGLILGLLLYYQNQGYIKVFQTAEDRAIKRLLVIDRSKFATPEGLAPDKFEAKIKELEAQRKAVLDNPQDVQAWFMFGHTKEFLNDHAGAVAVWEKAFALQPLNFVASLNLANNYQYFLKDYNRAEFYYKKTIEIRPGLTAAYQGLMDLYRYNFKDRQAEFEPTVLLAVKFDPQNSAQYYANLTEFFAEGQNLDKAKQYLARVQALDARAYNDLIAAYPALK